MMPHAGQLDVGALVIGQQIDIMTKSRERLDGQAHGDRRSSLGEEWLGREEQDSHRASLSNNCSRAKRTGDTAPPEPDAACVAGFLHRGLEVADGMVERE